MRYLSWLVVALAVGGCSRRPSNSLLERRIERASGSADIVFHQVCDQLDVPCGIEEYGLGLASYAEEKQSDLRKDGASAVDILDAIVSRKPDYKWTFDGKVLTIQPAALNANDPLEKTIPSIDLAEVPSPDAMKAVLGSVGVHPSMGSSGVPFLREYPKITLHLTGLTARQGLNQVVAADGKLTWHIGFSSSAGKLSQPALEIISRRPGIPTPFGSKREIEPRHSK